MKRQTRHDGGRRGPAQATTAWTRRLVLLHVAAFAAASVAAQPDPPFVQLDDLVFIGAHSARQAFDGQSFEAEGDLRLRSRKWTIHADNARLSGPLGDPDLIRVEGRPARIVFDRGAGREPLEGRSSLLEFEPARDVLRLEGDARIVRGQQSISSDSIRYLVERDTFAAGESGRVRVVTKPR